MAEAGAVRPMEHKDPVMASNPARIPPTRPRQERLREDIPERKVMEF